MIYRLRKLTHAWVSEDKLKTRLTSILLASNSSWATPFLLKFLFHRIVCTVYFMIAAFTEYTHFRCSWNNWANVRATSKLQLWSYRPSSVLGSFYFSGLIFFKIGSLNAASGPSIAKRSAAVDRKDLEIWRNSRGLLLVIGLEGGFKVWLG